MSRRKIVKLYAAIMCIALHHYLVSMFDYGFMDAMQEIKNADFYTPDGQKWKLNNIKERKG